MARTYVAVGPNGTVSRAPLASTAVYTGGGSDTSTSWLSTDKTGGKNVRLTTTTQYETVGSAPVSVPAGSTIISIGLKFVIKNNTDHLWTGTTNIFWNDTAPVGAYTYRGSYLTPKFWSMLPSTIAPGYVEYSTHWIHVDGQEIYQLTGGQTMGDADIIAAINGGYNSFFINLDHSVEFSGGPVNDFQIAYIVMTVEYGTDEASGSLEVFQYLTSNNTLVVSELDVGSGAIQESSPESPVGVCFQFPGTVLPDGSYLFRHDPTDIGSYDWSHLSYDLTTWTTVTGPTDATLRTLLTTDGPIISYTNTSVLFFSDNMPTGTDVYLVDFNTWSYSLVGSVGVDNATGTGYRCQSQPFGSNIYLSDNSGTVRSIDMDLNSLLIYKQSSPLQGVYTSPILVDYFDTLTAPTYSDGYIWAAVCLLQKGAGPFPSINLPASFILKVDPATGHAVGAYYAADTIALDNPDANAGVVGNYLLIADPIQGVDLHRFDVSNGSFYEYFLFGSGNFPPDATSYIFPLSHGFSYPSTATSRLNEALFSSPANRRTMG